MLQILLCYHDVPVDIVAVQTISVHTAHIPKFLMIFNQSFWPTLFPPILLLCADMHICMHSSQLQLYCDAGHTYIHTYIRISQFQLYSDSVQASNLEMTKLKISLKISKLKISKLKISKLKISKLKISKLKISKLKISLKISKLKISYRKSICNFGSRSVRPSACPSPLPASCRLCASRTQCTWCWWNARTAAVIFLRGRQWVSVLRPLD
jgi:hypothetical protein